MIHCWGALCNIFRASQIVELLEGGAGHRRFDGKSSVNRHFNIYKTASWMVLHGSSTRVCSHLVRILNFDLDQQAGFVSKRGIFHMIYPNSWPQTFINHDQQDLFFRDPKAFSMGFPSHFPRFSQKVFRKIFPHGSPHGWCKH